MMIILLSPPDAIELPQILALFKAVTHFAGRKATFFVAS
jgi:hypothetical protein